MKRLVIMTVGKTHSGKTTFARALEKELDNSFVMDQDNQAAFLNTFYAKLQPEQGPNILKHSLSRLIIHYAIENTDLHLIVCNSNRSQQGRLRLLEGLFNKKQFVRILVHFDIPDDVLMERIVHSKRSTNVFRGAFTNFEEVLLRQQAESQLKDIVDPKEEEADYLFVMKHTEEVDSVIKRIVQISKML
ncbi:CRISPR-associated protein Cas2 [Oceanobacillus picturae]|uniref:CRISPR-associated protein Cas2 n=1 Tax=Oceanobacillus picturae TaxID=171693 RepID=A0A0U9H510_9BACI|nr:AAA family ATPase [Oceanobacillus picturae]GAQ17072.1 CRISPR-associated protein Cas2 [Oceanobacillus picturae]